MCTHVPDRYVHDAHAGNHNTPGSRLTISAVFCFFYLSYYVLQYVDIPLAWRSQAHFFILGTAKVSFTCARTLLNDKVCFPACHSVKIAHCIPLIGDVGTVCKGSFVDVRSHYFLKTNSCKMASGKFSISGCEIVWGLTTAHANWLTKHQC